MLFTKQNARLFAARSAEGRRQAKIVRLDRDRMLDRLIQEANDRSLQAVALAATVSANAEDGYLAHRLQRVRLQIDRLDDLIDASSDPGEIDRLAAASTRLAEQERLLDGRALPGSLRPSAPRAPKVIMEGPLD
jgi:hypothetical protein